MSTRTAWLLPALRRATYWDALLIELRRLDPDMRVFTGFWDPAEHDPALRDFVEVVGKQRMIGHDIGSDAYTYGVSLLSPRILGALRRVRPDVVVSSSFTMWTMLALLARPLLRYRVLIYLSGSSPSADMRGHRLRLAQRRLVARAADGAITNTERARRYLTEVLGMSEDDVFALPIVVPQVQPCVDRPAERPLRLVYVGRLVAPKGVADLLAACAQLVGEWTLDVVGDGDEAERLRRMVPEDRRERVRFLGWLPRERAMEVVREADAMAFPTYDDVWGQVALEAMACGTALVCSTAAGASELVEDGENGLLVEPGDVAGLRACLQRLVDEPGLTARLGESGAATVARHQPPLVAERLSGIVRGESAA